MTDLTKDVASNATEKGAAEIQFSAMDLTKNAVPKATEKAPEIPVSALDLTKESHREKGQQSSECAEPPQLEVRVRTHSGSPPSSHEIPNPDLEKEPQPEETSQEKIQTQDHNMLRPTILSYHSKVAHQNL